MEILQLLINGLLAGALLAMPAIGFTTLYAVLRFPNFAVASLATIGAYAGFVVNVRFGLPAWLALLAAFLAGGLFGVASDELVLRRLRPAGPITAAIASVALTIVLENVVRFCFGNEPHGYALPVLRDWRIGGLRIGPQQALDALAAILAMAALFTFLGFTRTGKTMRALADNPTLAALKGIEPVRIARLASFLGMGLAGFGGMLIALDSAIDPLTGFRVVLSVFAASVVGGLGSIPGAIAGALVVGVGEELSVLVLDPSYRGAIGFAAILLVLSLRPRGLLGERAY